MKIINLLTGEQNTGISPHASTHHAGGTDPISAQEIGAEVAGAANSAIAAHTAQANPHSQYLEEVSWGIISGKPAYFPPFSAPITYGAVTVEGSTGTYSGFRFASTQGPSHFMVRNSDGLSGIYRVDTSSWRWYFDGSGILTVGTIPYARTTGVAATAENSFPLPFGANWDNYGGTWETANYRKSDKKVTLSGLVKRDLTTGNTIGNLPAGYRPLKGEIFTVTGYHNLTYTNFRVDVLTSGAINIAQPLPANSIGYISLSGISFFVS